MLQSYTVFKFALSRFYVVYCLEMSRWELCLALGGMASYVGQLLAPAENFWSRNIGEKLLEPLNEAKVSAQEQGVGSLLLPLHWLQGIKHCRNHSMFQVIIFCTLWSLQGREDGTEEQTQQKVKSRWLKSWVEALCSQIVTHNISRQHNLLLNTRCLCKCSHAMKHKPFYQHLKCLDLP